MIKEAIRGQIFGGCLRDFNSHLEGNYKGCYVVMEPLFTYLAAEGAGLVGAFLGALIGGALWVLIFKLGYIAGIAGRSPVYVQ